MKKIISIFGILFLSAFFSAAWAANATTISTGGLYISIILDGSTDWNGMADGKMPNGAGLVAIKFFPSAVNDVLVVRNYSPTVPEIFHGKDILGGGLADSGFHGRVCYPYIAASDCTLATPANARVIMIFDQITK
jgi:hypothetical protein